MTLAALVAEHGPVSWPAAGDGPPAALLVPLAPFRGWLDGRYRELGSYEALARRLEVNASTVSRWLRGERGAVAIRRETVERALRAWPDAPTFAELYAT